ncbi:MAG: ABC transporter permease [Kineosporiaceae bacterium]
MTTLAVLTGRSARLGLRSVDGLITALVLPVVILLVFVELFGGALDTRSTSSYATFVVPGIIAITAGFGVGTSAVTVCQDVTSGVIDRLRTLDVGAGALLASHVATAVARNLASTALVVLAGLAVGFRPHAGIGAWLLAGLVLTAYLHALTWVAACAGAAARSVEAAGGATFALMFLAYPSSAVVPVETMPGWLQGFAAHQPVTPVVDSVRGLLTGAPMGEVTGTLVTALAWCAAIAVVAGGVSRVVLARRLDGPGA